MTAPGCLVKHPRYGSGRVLDRADLGPPACFAPSTESDTHHAAYDTHNAASDPHNAAYYTHNAAYYTYNAAYLL